MLVGGVDTVVYYAPGTVRKLDHGVVCRAEDAVDGILPEHYGLFGDCDFAEGRVRCALGHMVVG